MNAKQFYYRTKLLRTVSATETSPRAFRLLHEKINAETDEPIGFNTLRRFFGLLPGALPSRKTWRILEHYLHKERQSFESSHMSYIQEWQPYLAALGVVGTLSL